MPECYPMESERQATLLGIFSPSDFGLSMDQVVDTSTQTVVTPVRLVYLKTENLSKTTVADESLHTESEDEEHCQTKGRKRNPEGWRQNVRKKKKNLGLEYVKSNGKLSAKKEMGPPCSCKSKCYQRIGDEACEKIFTNFWKLGDYSLQNAYIAGCVRIFLPKYCTKKNEEGQSAPSRRFYTRTFYVNVNGVDTEVCKQAFLNLHTISNGRLDRLLKKKQEKGNTGVDERGRHNNKVNKIPAEKVRDVRRFIDNVRKNLGFTGKRKSRNIEVFPAHYNIRYMYKKYHDDAKRMGHEPVCEFRFRKIFHTDFRIEFARATVSQTPPPAAEAPSPIKPSPPPVEPLLPPMDDKQPLYTTLEEPKGDAIAGQDTYHLTFTQEIYSPYPLNHQTWLFSAQP